MRLVALSGLLICSLAATPRAAADDADRFLQTAKKLIQAINSDDVPAIKASLDVQMDQVLPPDKVAPFFRAIAAAKGKLKEVGAPQVAGPIATLRVTAERGAWDFKIALTASGKIAGLLISEAAALAPASGSASAAGSTAVRRSRTPMQLPFRGEWYVFGGGDNESVNPHVSAPGQCRAADIIIKGPDDTSHKGSGRRNEDYFVYGKQVLAAASGTVVTAIDGVPDNQPGSMNPLCAVGNCLIIDQGSKEYAVYAHLKPGSLRVHSGDKINKGQVLALCGNSGNSSEPHLHFHLQDSAILQDGTGITPYFTNVKCRRGNTTLTDAEYTFLQGDRIQYATKK